MKNFPPAVWSGAGLLGSPWWLHRKLRQQPLQVPALALPRPRLVAKVREQAAAAAKMFNAAMRRN